MTLRAINPVEAKTVMVRWPAAIENCSSAPALASASLNTDRNKRDVKAGARRPNQKKRILRLTSRKARVAMPITFILVIFTGVIFIGAGPV